MHVCNDCVPQAKSAHALWSLATPLGRKAKQLNVVRAIVNNFDLLLLISENQSNQNIGRFIGMSKNETVTTASCLDLHRARHSFFGVGVNCLEPSLSGQLEVKKLCCDGLTEVADKIAVRCELETEFLIPHP